MRPVAASRSNDGGPLNEDPAQVTLGRVADVAQRYGRGTKRATDSVRVPSEPEPAVPFQPPYKGAPASAAQDGGVSGLTTTFGSGDGALPAPGRCCARQCRGRRRTSRCSSASIHVGFVRPCLRLSPSRASQEERHEDHAAGATGHQLLDKPLERRRCREWRSSGLSRARLAATLPVSYGATLIRRSHALPFGSDHGGAGRVGIKSPRTNRRCCRSSFRRLHAATALRCQ